MVSQYCHYIRKGIRTAASLKGGQAAALFLPWMLLLSHCFAPQPENELPEKLLVFCEVTGEEARRVMYSKDRVRASTAPLQQGIASYLWLKADGFVDVSDQIML